MIAPLQAAASSSSFPVDDTVGAWVPHGRFVIEGAPAGELTGLTFAAKDLFHVAGHPTGAGNPTWLATQPIPSHTSPLIETLLANGATLVGKTVTDELAHSIHGDNVHYGMPLNVRAPERVPGGSSSGSVAAVAAGLCDFALASDTGGSTRVPASYCGVWGIRTTHGLLPRTCMVPLSPSFDTATWFAHDAGTFQRVANALLPAAPMHAFTRVMLLEDMLVPATAEFRAQVEKVFAVLGLKHEAVRTTVTCNASADELELWRQTYLIAAGYEAWQTHGGWIEEHRPVFGPAIAGRWSTVSTISTFAAEAAYARQDIVRRRVRTLLGENGVAVIPSAAGPAPLRTASVEENEDGRSRTFRITCVAGLAGLPQVSMPFISAAGLPVGVSLLGPAGSDRALIDLAVSIWNDLRHAATN